jgi:tetratricopeptide (TPR) repeat protein
LTEATRILGEAKTLKEKCPLYWRVLMRDALGLQIDKTRFDAIFDEAIKFEPDFENYYFRRVIYLLPRWYGSEGEWQNDLTMSADKIGGENGDMFYAQVIWNMNQPSYFQNPFMEDNVSWTRVDKGFEVIEKYFPDSLAAKIERAQLAILANDAQAATYYNNGNNKQDKGDWAGAIADYNKAIEINPNFAKAYSNRGNAKRATRDLDGALADYNKAIEIKPDYGLAFYNRAIIKQNKGDLDGAMIDDNKAIELNPNFAQAYRARGIVKQLKGDNSGAAVDFNQAAKF